MVDVGEKFLTERVAVASGNIFVGEEVYHAIESGTAKKGDVLGVARIAGIMTAKKTSDVIPLCHPLPLNHCSLDFELLPEESAVKVTLHAPSIALLTIYDMCKAIDKRMTLGEIRFEQKNGGKSGNFKS